MPITLLIHGPISAYSRRVFEDAHSALQRGLISECLISTYRKDRSALERALGDKLYAFKVVLGDDVPNPGFANINRQINLVRLGLTQAQHPEHIFIKLRTDQRVNLAAVARWVTSHELSLTEGKLGTTNCYTRKDRLYHPSDMFVIGTLDTLMAYYPCTPFTQTELDDRLAIIAESRLRGKLLQIHQWPESRLFRSLLTSRGWLFRETVEDSLLALRAHCLMIDSRSIELRWEKFYGGRVNLVPYEFSMSPFAETVKERARCYSVHDIHGRDAMQSRISKWMTRILWNDFYLAGKHYGNYWKGFRKVLKGQYSAK